MKNNKILWGIILFILMPLAYYLAFISFTMFVASGKILNLLLLLGSIAFLIATNIYLLKAISK